VLPALRDPLATRASSPLARLRRLAIAIPPDYPFTAPAITFVTPCWHPNVDAHGAICVDFLKERWSAAYSVSSLLLSLQSLLADPNTASPLNTAAAALWGNDVEYRRTLLAKYKEATGGGPAA
jgi:ubiquitin-conjugating enzyme E2 C